MTGQGSRFYVSNRHQSWIFSTFRCHWWRRLKILNCLFLVPRYLQHKLVFSEVGSDQKLASNSDDRLLLTISRPLPTHVVSARPAHLITFVCSIISTWLQAKMSMTTSWLSSAPSSINAYFIAAYIRESCSLLFTGSMITFADNSQV